MAPGDWRFLFKNLKMSDQDLIRYQRKLLEIRFKYGEKVKGLSNCKFYDGEKMPPPNNIFGEFVSCCKRHHHPECTGWYLIWNPNEPLNHDKTYSHVHNHCSTWEFKSVSKKIQHELEKDFGSYFEMYDDDDTHPYCMDSNYNLKYGFKSQDEEYPDYVASKIGNVEDLYSEI
jgi:hypothetical protein